MLTRKQYWHKVMKLDKYPNNLKEEDACCQIPLKTKHSNKIEKKDASCQIPPKEYCNKNMIVITGNVKKVRFNNYVYATLIPTRDELNQVYMNYQKDNIDDFVLNIDDDFN